MLNFANNLSKARSRTSGVADSKPDEGFKVVDRRLFTEEGELRKDAADQDRRWDEDSKKAASSSPSRPPAKETHPSVQSSEIAGIATNGEEAEAHTPSHNFQMLVD